MDGQTNEAAPRRILDRTTDGHPIRYGLRVTCSEYPGNWTVVEVHTGQTYGVRLVLDESADEEYPLRKWVHYRSLTRRHG